MSVRHCIYLCGTGLALLAAVLPACGRTRKAHVSWAWLTLLLLAHGAHWPGNSNYPQGWVVAILILASVPVIAALARIIASVIRIEEQRRQAAAALRESRELFECFMSNSPAVAFMKDEGGRYIYVNKLWERFFSEAEHDCEGKTDFDIWPSETAEKLRRNDLAVFATGSTIAFFETVPREGAPSHWLVFKFPIKDAAGRKFLGGMAVDITEHKRAEEALKKRLAYEQMVAEISFRAVTNEDVVRFQDECMEIIGRTLDISRAYIFEYRRDTDTVDNTFEWVASGITAQKGNLQDIPTDLTPWWTDVLAKNQIINFSDIEDIPSEPEKEVLRPQAIKSILVVPLFVEKRLHGFMGLDECRHHRQWPDEDVDMLKTTARIICGVIERKQAEASLRTHTLAMNAASDSIVVTDADGRIEFANRAFEQETGYRMDEVAGKKPSILKSGKHDSAFYAHMWNTILTGRTWHGEITNRRKDGSLYTNDMTITPVRRDTGTIEHFIAIRRDITEKKVYEERLDHLAHHDLLTGLPNRLLFSDRLTHSLSDARRHDRQLAVMFLDIDRFKLINDTLGHNIGDLLLRAVAERLKSCLRKADTIARMGGDEFTVIVADVHSAQDAGKVARKVLNALSRLFVIQDRELFLTASIGISMFPSDGEDVETLVRNADAAMYRAKEHGSNTYQIYTEALNIATLERMTLENGLRKALEREDFLVYYQPRVDIKTGKIVGAEALVRWQHPELGLIYPGQFIPLAEENGLIIPLTEWVLGTACRQNKAWQDDGFPPIDIAVNISLRQFQRADLKRTVRRILKESGLDAECLNLEITESTLMYNPSAASAVLGKLKTMGVRISIDDFGTGYSSLSYLKRFPIDAVKIDQSFVRDITIDPDDAAIAGAVVAMAHSLNLEVIAEGVETLEQLNFLNSINCDEMQGYFVSRPVPADEFVRILWDAESSVWKTTDLAA